jgi:hypothetical protein
MSNKSHISSYATAPFFYPIPSLWRPAQQAQSHNNTTAQTVTAPRVTRRRTPIIHILSNRDRRANDNSICTRRARIRIVRRCPRRPRSARYAVSIATKPHTAYFSWRASITKTFPDNTAISRRPYSGVLAVDLVRDDQKGNAEIAAGGHGGDFDGSDAVDGCIAAVAEHERDCAVA